MSVIDEIAAERARQVNAEGWAPEHDDEHDGCELARAAAVYAFTSTFQDHQRVAWREKLSEPVTSIETHDGTVIAPGVIRLLWPWEPQWFKPKSQRADLIRAAALIVAEIERIDRAAQP